MLKVGELAQRTGLTVRALHHYDDIGLLRPARRTTSGHRYYDAPEVARLQRIKSLQQLGFSLDEIAALLQRDDFSAQQIVHSHLDQARAQLHKQQGLVDRLQRIADRLDAMEEPPTELLLETIEAMNMFEKYYTPDQLRQLESRRAEVGEERIAAAQGEWQQLYADAHAEVERGTDPASEAAQELVRRSRALIAEFTGGDAGIEASLSEMRAQEPSVQQQWGPPPEVADFLQRAAAVADD